ncbi:hypothetical protein KY346_00085 [Candidatus Woesearchaeota archaeon]|nr:hypothetical protein [Candidatus Woesearchaeota archaeon]
MRELKTFIQNLKNQGEQLINQIPLKKHFKEQEKLIKKQYQRPLASEGRRLISVGAGELATSIFGGGKGFVKKLALDSLKQEQDRQINQEVQRVWDTFNQKRRELEEGYKAWFSSAEEAIKSINSTRCFKKLRESKQKAKLETKIRSAISALDFALDFLDEPGHIKKVALIKAGEPLKGRDMIRGFLEGAKKYIKIQEPYPNVELLRLLDGLPSSVEVQLLLGPFGKNPTLFKRELELLRKSGMGIKVFSINARMSAPFHDRFMIHETGAISLGTSVQGIGLRDSAINELSEWKEIERRFDEYFNSSIISHRGSGCKKNRL